MELKWGIFAPCINEIELIEAKLEWALERFDDIVMVEGHHKRYTNVNESGLSLDGTTEILKSYSDRIKYRPVGAINDVMDIVIPVFIELIILSKIVPSFLFKTLVVNNMSVSTE